MKQQFNTFSILSIVLGVMAVFSITTVVFPFFFGSLSIIFAVLAKGSSLKMDFMSKSAVAASLFGIILSFGITAGTMYLLATNEDFRGQINTMYEESYGFTLDEYMEMINNAWETGEIPEEWNDRLDQLNLY